VEEGRACGERWHGVTEAGWWNEKRDGCHPIHPRVGAKDPEELAPTCRPLSSGMPQLNHFWALDKQ